MLPEKVWLALYSHRNREKGTGVITLLLSISALHLAEPVFYAHPGISGCALGITLFAIFSLSRQYSRIKQQRSTKLVSLILINGSVATSLSLMLTGRASENLLSDMARLAIMSNMMLFPTLMLVHLESVLQFLEKIREPLGEDFIAWHDRKTAQFVSGPQTLRQQIWLCLLIVWAHGWVGFLYVMWVWWFLMQTLISIITVIPVYLGFWLIVVIEVPSAAEKFPMLTLVAQNLYWILLVGLVDQVIRLFWAWCNLEKLDDGDPGTGALTGWKISSSFVGVTFWLYILDGDQFEALVYVSIISFLMHGASLLLFVFVKYRHQVARFKAWRKQRLATR